MTHVMLLAGEPSGDSLGAELIAALKATNPKAENPKEPLRFSGVGGRRMTAEGLESLFPLEEMTVFGLLEVIRRLPSLLARIRQTAAAVIDSRPDVLVLIDSPDFTHRVARKVRRALPGLPIVNYPPPTVWAWRSGRARKMRAYVTRVFSIFPFEPKVFAELGGPDCVYVGHPFMSRRAGGEAVRGFRARLGIEPAAPLLLAAPGSRASEIRRLMGPIGEAVRILAQSRPGLRVVVPVAAPVEHLVEAALADWPLRPILIRSDADKHAAFGAADCALAASGTVNMELGISGMPFVCVYRLGRIEWSVTRVMFKIDWVCPVNLILGRQLIPELLQQAATGPALARAVKPLFSGPARDAQLAGLAALNEKLAAGITAPPASMAAAQVWQLLGRDQRLSSGV